MITHKVLVWPSAMLFCISVTKQQLYRLYTVKVVKGIFVSNLNVHIYD